jgi:hypothetical protein
VKLRKVYRRGVPYPVWVEVYPERCPGCDQPYRGGHCQLGWMPCGCNPKGSHRTLYCRDCGAERMFPPHTQEHGPYLVGSEPTPWPWYPP